MGLPGRIGQSSSFTPSLVYFLWVIDIYSFMSPPSKKRPLFSAIQLTWHARDTGCPVPGKSRDKRQNKMTTFWGVSLLALGARVLSQSKSDIPTGFCFIEPRPREAHLKQLHSEKVTLKEVNKTKTKTKTKNPKPSAASPSSLGEHPSAEWIPSHLPPLSSQPYALWVVRAQAYTQCIYFVFSVPCTEITKW